jgi:TatA/E family protein of Tat protein translocase
MFGHIYELVVVLVLGLIFFGPAKLPEIAHSAGKMVAEFRAALDTVASPDQELDDDEFATYYYDSLKVYDGEEIDPDYKPDPADDVEYEDAEDSEFDDFEHPAASAEPEAPEPEEDDSETDGHPRAKGTGAHQL